MIFHRLKGEIDKANVGNERIGQMKAGKESFYSKYIKRLLDILISATVLLSLCWLYALLALIVRIMIGAPVLFKQDRPGKNGKIFKLYKFRSMSNAKDENGNLLPDKERLNGFGRLFRSTSLDELPEVFNILKGDMSLIGPRPLLVRYLDHYNVCENRRHEVRPGLTGLAQVSGRNTVTWKEKFQKDVEYVNRLSFGLDVKIFFLTIGKVFQREGIEYQRSDTINDYFDSSDRLT